MSLRIVLVSRLLKPCESLFFILVRAFPGPEHDACLSLCGRIALFRSQPVVFQGLLIVFVRSVSLVIDLSQAIPGIRISLLRGFCIPGKRFLVVLFNAAAAEICFSKLILRGSIARLRFGQEFPDLGAEFVGSLLCRTGSLCAGRSCGSLPGTSAFCACAAGPAPQEQDYKRYGSSCRGRDQPFGKLFLLILPVFILRILREVDLFVLCRGSILSLSRSRLINSRRPGCSILC